MTAVAAAVGAPLVAPAGVAQWCLAPGVETGPHLRPCHCYTQRRPPQAESSRLPPVVEPMAEAA
eukprot:COSAG03_NODE_16252_length_407_cov_0.840909_1_plen_63_part_01